MKETLLKEKEELLLHLETLKDSQQPLDLVIGMRDAISERIRLIDSQLYNLEKQEHGI